MRVLIVDDAPDVCRLHERFLRLLGHEARCAENGTAAIAEAKRFKPDVILLDICMPGMDGWEVAEKLRADPETHDIRIVVVSAMLSSESEKRSREVGIEAHYRKPVALAQWPKLLAGPATASPL